jgi:hypothetical protein
MLRKVQPYSDGMDTVESVVMPTHLVEFAPSHWGQLEHFVRFCGTTYRFSWQVTKRLSGIIGNANKFAALIRLAKRVAPELAEDDQQMEEHGFSPALRAKELAAVCETAFCTLYSMLDCTRHVLCSIYPNHKGIRDSTRSTFQNGHKGAIDLRIPVAIREAIKETQAWFDKLREIRDELTHADVGFCTLDGEKGTVTYLHGGLGTRERAFVLEDVFGELDGYYQKINGFLGKLFLELNKTIVDSDTEQMCGVFNYRWYSRIVKPSEATDFHSGRCKSYEWFDQEGQPPCPFRETCGAYAAATSRQKDGGN